MIAALFYAVGLLLICYEAARHGAVQVSIAFTWAVAVWLYALVGAVIVRAVIARGARAPGESRGRYSELLKSAQRADAEARKREAQP